MSSSLREPLSFACWQGYHTGNGNVFAVHGTDAAGVSAILASWEHCGRTGTTNLGCRCTAQDVSGDDWTADEYDDSQWPYAADGGVNGELPRYRRRHLGCILLKTAAISLLTGVDPWGPNRDIDRSARWIWAADMMGTDEAFCRW